MKMNEESVHDFEQVLWLHLLCCILLVRKLKALSITKGLSFSFHFSVSHDHLAPAFSWRSNESDYGLQETTFYSHLLASAL